MNPATSRCLGFREIPWIARVNALGLCAAALAYSVFLLPQWLHDDNLTHGLFLPVMAVILVMESRRDPFPRFLSPGPGLLAAGGMLLILSLASLATAIIYAAALGWTHTVAEFLLGAALVVSLGAAWIGFSERRVGFLPFNWAAAVAVIIWIFASPPPPGSYARLTLLLQADVTHGVVRILNAFGIAAYQDGNVIELARTSVGVSEACSGVKSLVSCVVAGLFLSAVLVHRTRNRILVVLLSPVIGLAMNLVRSLFLTLLANAGVNIEGRWHDLTGASILVVTTLLVAALGLALRRQETALKAGPGGTATPTPGRSPLQVLTAACLLVAALAAGVLASAARGVEEPRAQVLDLGSLLPDPMPGWTAETTPHLDENSDILATRDLVERVYSTGTGKDVTYLTLYLAYWRPGQAAVSLVDAHTPDACWPGTGWESRPVPADRESLVIAGRELAPAECRLFAHEAYQTHVWFWHLYGGKPLTYVDPHSAVRLLKLAWKYGFGQAKDQLFIRVSSNRPWEEVAAQGTLQQFIRSLKPLGL